MIPLKPLLTLLIKMAPYVLKTVWLNFRFLPFSQAKRLPILVLSKSKIKIKGKILLETTNCDLRFGMIKLGMNFHTNQPNLGINMNIKKGGLLIFAGKAQFGHNTCIEVGERGRLYFGGDFSASYGVKFYTYHNVWFGKQVLMGWDSVVMDTAFHSLKFLDGKKTKGYSSIKIGNNVWIPSYCRIMAGSVLPDYTILASGSYCSKDFSNIPPYSLLAGNPLEVKKTGIYRDVADDEIIYE